MNNSILNSNQIRLREAANKLLDCVGSNENLVNYAKPIVESLIVQVQSYFINNSQNSFCNSTPFQSQNLNISQQQKQQKINYDEKQRIAMRMSGFQLKGNRIWEELSSRFGANIKRGELTNIAQVLANAAHIKLDRDAKRRKSVLLKWFEEHWDALYELLDYVVLDNNENENEESEYVSESENQQNSGNLHENNKIQSDNSNENDSDKNYNFDIE